MHDLKPRQQCVSMGSQLFVGACVHARPFLYCGVYKVRALSESHSGRPRFCAPTKGFSWSCSSTAGQFHSRLQVKRGRMERLGPFCRCCGWQSSTLSCFLLKGVTLFVHQYPTANQAAHISAAASSVGSRRKASWQCGSGRFPGFSCRDRACRCAQWKATRFSQSRLPLPI